VIDHREKEALFEQAIARNKGLLGVIARNNAPVDSWQDLEQEILIALWKSLDSYDGESSRLDTWFVSVARNTARDFKRRNHTSRKRHEGIDPGPAVVDHARDELRIIEEFSTILGELDRQVFTMYLDDLSYAEISAALGIEEVNLRKRMSRIKEQFKAIYRGV